MQSGRVLKHANRVVSAQSCAGGTSSNPVVSAREVESRRHGQKSREQLLLDALKFLGRLREKLGFLGMAQAVGLLMCAHTIWQPVPVMTLALRLLCLVAFSFLMMLLSWVNRKLNPQGAQENDRSMATLSSESPSQI